MLLRRTLPFAVWVMLVAFSARTQAQHAEFSFFGRQADARSEAMGRGNVALLGDVRSLPYNPAALMDLRGFDVHGHSANKWYLYERSQFSHLAFGYRIAERWAFGAAVDKASIKSDVFSFGDEVEPRRGFIYQTFDGFIAPEQRLAVSFAGAPMEHLHVGVTIGNIPLATDDNDVLYGSIGFAHGGELHTKGALRHSFRVAASTQNFSFSEESNTGYRRDLHGQIDSVFRVTDHLPAIFRGGIGYTLKYGGFRLRDTLSTAALTMHVQYDDDMTQRYRSAFRIGGELLLLDILALRIGWYRESVDNGGNDLMAEELEQFTYGFGLIVPLAALTKGAVPITVAFDYTDLPQVSYSADGLGLFNKPWENFQSIGLRINYGLGPLLKAKSRT